MNMFVNALILALMVPAGSAQTVDEGPACRAELRGVELLTTIDLRNGVQVEGPWRVVLREDRRGGASLVMFATLDRLIEKDALTGGRNTIPFPAPVSLAFQGDSREELMERAAQVWCATVMRAQDNPALQHTSPTRALNARVASSGMDGRDATMWLETLSPPSSGTGVWL